MILRRETIEERLKELDEILGELSKHGDVTWEVFCVSLFQNLDFFSALLEPIRFS